MRFLGLENYSHMLFGDAVFCTTFLLHLGYLAISLCRQLGGALGVACLLLAITRGREIFKVLYLMPAVIATPAIALLFQRIYSFEPAGLINSALSTVGLDGLARPDRKSVV